MFAWAAALSLRRGFLAEALRPETRFRLAHHAFFIAAILARLAALQSVLPRFWPLAAAPADAPDVPESVLSSLSKASILSLISIALFSWATVRLFSELVITKE